MNKLISSILLVLLVGCSDSSTHSRETEPTADPADHPIRGHQQALDRAREVEQDVLEAAERQRDAIDEQEGGG